MKIKTLGIALLTLTILISHVPPGICAQEETEQFLVAQKAFDDGFYEVAIGYIEKFMARFPQSSRSIEARLLLGQCFFYKSQYLSALKVFEDLMKYSTHKDATLFWLGETYYKGSDPARAQNYYTQVLEQYPESMYTPQSYYSLGWLLFEKGQFDEAQKNFKQLYEKFSDHALAEEAMIKSGECAFNLYNYKGAIEQFENFTSRYPNSTRLGHVLFYVGEAYYYLENFKQALAHYTKASELSQEPQIVFVSKVSMGWCQLKLNQLDAAEKTFAQAKAEAQGKKFPLDEIILGEATLLTTKGEYAKALEDFNQLISDFPDSKRITEAYLGKANALYMLEQYDHALREYSKILEQKDISQDIKEKTIFGTAWTYLKKGDTQRAIQNFNRIVSETHSRVTKISALTQIGDAYQDAGEISKAIEIYDSTLKDYPDSVYADYLQYRQGIALLKLDKIESATLSFQSLKRNYPKSTYLTEAGYYLGVAYFKKNDFRAALGQIEPFLQVAMSNHELRPQAQFILASCLYHLKETQKALNTFQQIVASYPAESEIVSDSELGIAKCLFDLNDVDEAVKHFKAIISKYPRTSISLDSLLWLADYSSKSGNLADTVNYYRQIITDFPQNEKLPQVRFALSEAYSHLGEPDKALNELNLIGPGAGSELYSRAQMSIAEIFSGETDPQTAINRYQTIVTNSPDYARDALVKLAQLYEDKNDLPAALEQYRKALSQPKASSHITNAEVQFFLADLYDSMNESKLAIESYLKIPYLYPKEIAWGIKAYLRVARIFENDEDWDSAKIVYEKILELDVEESKFARERLSWIEENITAVK